ncbi:hypothetical protein JCGZ_22772 [Jatropha curcas]|uniref:Uncharacterized protein n=1 Tax=Jatropha curcas TaxID=180498 RepID=A0A067LFG8_JATCU|nr:hypothetical protein JCGZ_22772 [Jatropha curcas]
MESRLARDFHASPESETKKEREKLAVDEGEDWNRSVVTRSPENQWSCNATSRSNESQASCDSRAIQRQQRRSLAPLGGYSWALFDSLVFLQVRSDYFQISYFY